MISIMALAHRTAEAIAAAPAAASAAAPRRQSTAYLSEGARRWQ